VFIGSVVLTGAGALAYVYADHHQATPEADPMAADLSPNAYRWLHYGAIALTVLGVLLLVLGLIAAANYGT